MNSKKITIEILASIFLALTCISFGYAMCAGIPFITEKVASATVNDEDSPFNKLELVEAAEAVRDYSFGSHSKDSLYASIANINSEANTPYAAYAGETTEDLKNAPEQYTITEEQISHLNDVYDISSRMMMPIFGVVAITIFLLMIGLRMFGTDAAARSMKWGGILAIALLALITIFAIVAFDTFFAAFHEILFSNDNWQFASDSLLICALPESFWATMAGVWGILSALLATVSVACGLIMLHKKEPASNASPQK